MERSLLFSGLITVVQSGAPSSEQLCREVGLCSVCKEMKEAEVPGGFCLFLLLLKSALQLSFSLRQLQLQPQHLGLLSLEGRKKRGICVENYLNYIKLN